MFKKWPSLFWGLLLLPLTLSTLHELPAIAWSWDAYAEGVLALVAGVVLYGLFEAAFNRPMRTYVFGHELTHALASVMMGGKVHDFKVSKHGGHVTLSKSNFFVALAPYCVPLYTLIALAGYFILQFWLPMEQYRWGLLALIGFTLAFHASLTLFAIRQDQPDLRQTGVFFSLVFIVLINAWVLVLVSKALFWDLFSIRAFVLNTLRTQTAIWRWAGLKAWTLGRRAVEYGAAFWQAR